MSKFDLRGVWTASLTPFDDAGNVDHVRLTAHCRSLLEQGCRGVSLFGTTGEGTQLSAEERMAGLEAVARSVAPALLMPATGYCDLPTTVAMSRHAAGVGCPAVLLLPPFYQKPVSDEGLFRYFAQMLDRTGDVPVLLYNFPDLAGVPLSPALIRRLATAYPQRILGLKDSSGQSDAFLAELKDLLVFVGDERTIGAALAAGGAGTISGMANFVAPLLRRLYDERTPAAQAAVDAEVERMLEGAFTPAAKARLAAERGDPGWARVRPPLLEA